MDGHYTILNRQQEVANVFIQQNKHKLKTHNLICVCVSGRTKKQWWSLISHVGVICSRLKERLCLCVCVCVCVCDARL